MKTLGFLSHLIHWKAYTIIFWQMWKDVLGFELRFARIVCIKFIPSVKKYIFITKWIEFQHLSAYIMARQFISVNKKRATNFSEAWLKQRQLCILIKLDWRKESYEFCWSLTERKRVMNFAEAWLKQRLLWILIKLDWRKESYEFCWSLTEGKRVMNFDEAWLKQRELWILLKLDWRIESYKFWINSTEIKRIMNFAEKHKES